MYSMSVWSCQIISLSQGIPASAQLWEQEEEAETALPSGGLLVRNDSEIVLPLNQRKLLKIKTVTCMDFFFLCLPNPIARRNINNLRYADDTTLMAETYKELRSFLMKVKEEREKCGLKLTFTSWNGDHGICPISSWQIDGGKSGNSARFQFLCLRNPCRWWLQPWN